MREVVVFSGSAHEPLAHRICDELGVELSQTALSRFSNDCLQAQLLANCRQRDVYIVQPLVPPTQDSLMELLLMIDAAKGASAGMITAVIPHYAYARSDKKDASRISLGGRLVADLISTAGADRVLTMNLHAPQVHGFFSVPVDHLTAIGVLAGRMVVLVVDRCQRGAGWRRNIIQRIGVDPGVGLACGQRQQQGSGKEACGQCMHGDDSCCDGLREGGCAFSHCQNCAMHQVFVFYDYIFRSY